MKTYILSLEPNDDLISLRDKMGWAKSNRILIVYPKGEALLNRRLDLVLLHRRSEELGAQLAIVSRDPEIRYHAPRLGIPVFSTLKRAQTAHWRIPYRFRKQKETGLLENFPEHARKKFSVLPKSPSITDKPLGTVSRLLFFTAGVFSLLAIAATLVPSAQIVIQPETRLQDMILEVYTDPHTTEINLLGTVPSEIVSVEVEGRDSIATSGSILLPYQSATGSVVFRNLTDQEIEIPKRTVVRPTGGAQQRYATIRAGRVPAGTDQTLTIQVRCLNPGALGNLPANSIQAIEGQLGTLLSVTNIEPISGGSDRLEPAPTSQDRVLLSERLEPALLKTAEIEIQSMLGPNDLLLPGTLRVAEILDEDYQPDGVSPADQLSLSWQMRYEARVVRYNQLKKMVLAVLDANLRTGYLPINSSLTIELIKNPRFEEQGKIFWKVHATRMQQAFISDAQVVRLAVGLPPDQVASCVRETLLIEKPPQIFLQPTWWPRMPVLPFRIEIRQDELESLLSVGQRES